MASLLIVSGVLLGHASAARLLQDRQAAIVLFDQSDSMWWFYQNHINNQPVALAAIEALRRELPPGSSLRVASFGNFFLISREVAQSRDLRGELEVVLGRHGGQSPIWDAVFTSTGLLRPEKGVRAILLVTDGQSTANSHSHREALDYARQAGVRIIAAAIAGRGGLQVEAAERLKRLAADTGGSYRQVAPRDLPAFFKGALSARSQSGSEETLQLSDDVSGSLQHGYGPGITIGQPDARTTSRSTSAQIRTPQTTSQTISVLR